VRAVQSPNIPLLSKLRAIEDNGLRKALSLKWRHLLLP